MDPFAHTLVGATLSKTRLGHHTPWSMPVLIAAANLPDVDAAAYFISSDYALQVRRGLTHGPIAFVILPPLLVLLLRGLHRWRARDTHFATRRLLALAYLGCFTHPLLDWLNTYGVRLLMPFDERWFYGDVLFIVDPWFWLTLGAGLYLATEQTFRSQLLWAAMAAVATAAVLVGPVPPWSRVVWIAGVAACWLLSTRLASSARTRRHCAELAVGIWVLYLVFMFASSRLIRSEARAALAQEASERSLPTEARLLMAGPLPATATRRDLVVDTGDSYLVGTFDWRAQPHLHLDPGQFLKAPPELVQQAEPGFATWTRFPAIVSSSSNRSANRLLDVRYARRLPADGATGFGVSTTSEPREGTGQPGEEDG